MVRGGTRVASPDVVVCGEALIDIIEQADATYRAVPGGSPTNTATALGRLGVCTELLARVGLDRFGEQIRAHLRDSGVGLSLVVDTREPTTLAIAALDEHGSASYTFYVDGCADGTWSARALPADLGEAAFCVLAGSLSLATPGMGRAFDRLFEREAQRVLVFDPNVRRALTGERDDVRARLDRWIARSTIVKASAEDVAWRHPGRGVREVASQWLDSGPSLVVVTDGAALVHAVTRRHAVVYRAPPVEVVDTVGAGDTFTAGLVDWLLRHDVRSRDGVDVLNDDDLRLLLVAAAALASDTCTRRGADPPWRAASDRPARRHR